MCIKTFLRCFLGQGLNKIALYGPHSMWLVLTCIVVLGVAGCASKPQPLPFSGFLDNYSGIRPAPDESGVWVYRKADLNLNPYTKIMIDPLTVWPIQSSRYGGINTLAMWQLALAFQDRMGKALEGGYTVVSEPGPGVLRLRAALTHVTLERPSLKTPGPILPLANDILLMSSEEISGLMIRGGEATIEAELLDSQTQDRLVAYIEKRHSAHVFVAEDQYSFGPVLEIFEYWARKLRQRLDEERGLREYKKAIQ